MRYENINEKIKKHIYYSLIFRPSKNSTKGLVFSRLSKPRSETEVSTKDWKEYETD